MKNREGQVVATGEGGLCEWQSGAVRRQSDHISTTSSCGTSTFRLFDHITVSVDLSVRFMLRKLSKHLIYLHNICKAMYYFVTLINLRILVKA